MKETLQNICFCFQQMENRKKFIKLGIVHIILGMSIPFAVAAIPQMVIVYTLGKNSYFPFLLVFVTAVIFAQYVDMRCALESDKFLMLYRYSLGSSLFGSSFRKSVAYSESYEGKKDAGTARRAIYEGNYVGIEIFMKSVQSVVLSFGGIVVEIIVLWQFSWILSVCVVGSGILVILLNQNGYKNINPLQKKLGDYYTPLQNLYETSTDSGYRNDIWLYGFRNLFSEKFNQYRKAAYLLEKRCAGIITKTEILGLICTLMRDVVVYGLLIRQIYSGIVRADQFIFIALIVENCEKWTEEFVDYFQMILKNNYLVSAFRNYTDQKSGEAEMSGCPVQPLQREVEFRNVSFTYEKSEKASVKGVDLCIKKGEKIAVTGMNGAGKSTLIKLLLGIYTPSEGQILWDGKNISDMDWNSYKNHFSVVSQDCEVLPFSVAENIAGCAENRVNREQLAYAIKKADMSGVTEHLPKKESTPLTQAIDQNGVSLSGGETQKVFLARMIYRGGDILILDEPTAALDSISEEKLYLHLAEVIGDKTCIFISHRLNSTRFCDKILFLEDGKAVEFGTHQELMQNHGKYAQLYSLQAKRYQTNGD